MDTIQHELLVYLSVLYHNAPSDNHDVSEIIFKHLDPHRAAQDLRELGYVRSFSYYPPRTYKGSITIEGIFLANRELYNEIVNNIVGYLFMNHTGNLCEILDLENSKCQIALDFAIHLSNGNIINYEVVNQYTINAELTDYGKEVYNEAKPNWF